MSEHGSSRRLALLAIASVGVAVIALEVTSRYLAPAGSPFERRFPVELTRRPVPYAMFGGVPHARIAFGSGGVEELDAHGYRGPSSDTPRARGEVRVFVLGGSTVFAGERSIPDLLEEELRQRGITEVRVFNFGVVSSVSGQELVRLLLEVTDRDPDLVVFYNGGNDLLSPALYDPRPGYPFNFVAQESNPLLRRDISDYPAWTLFAYGSNVARAHFGGYFVRQFADLDSLRREVGYGTPAWKKAIVDSYVQRLTKAQRVSNAFGFDFVAILQPLLSFKAHLAPREERIIRESPDLASLASAFRESVRAEFIRARAQSKLRAVDFSTLFDSHRGEVFVDWIHTLPEGERHVALAMAEIVEPILRERLSHAVDASPKVSRVAPPGAPSISR